MIPRKAPDNQPARPRIPDSGRHPAQTPDETRIPRLLAAFFAIAAGIVLVPPCQAAERSDIVVADFERENFGGWTATGDAFGPGPVTASVPGQAPVEAFQGRRFVTSKHGGDASTGTLVSPPFKIERPYLRFLIGGGKGAKFKLLINGTEVRTAAGRGMKPGDSESLEPADWDVSEFMGKEAQLQLEDDSPEGWGHLNLDQVVQTDRKLAPVATDVAKEFVAEKRYLNMPMKANGQVRNVGFYVDGKPESAFSTFKMPLADEKPDWWAFRDISRFKGKTIKLVVDKLPEDSSALVAIEQSDEIRDPERLYEEERRPQLHFSPRRGGCGDANGLVYHEGEYHLFFQHNPFSFDGGQNSHWGHAISKDLVHWEEMPDALLPDDHGLQYSGSGLVDINNTAGLQTGQEKTLALIYSAAGRADGPTQCLAYSHDHGRTWTKFSGNPILPKVEPHNRDPRVLWYAPEKKWVMALNFGHSRRQSSGRPPTKPNYGLFSSKDLKQWERMSTVHIDDTDDCPEFFEIAVDGDKSRTKWIFYSGDAFYLVGTFDGKTFTPESGPHKLNLGNSFYASQTFNNIPEEDGRRILMARTQAGGPGAGFWGGIGLPVELTLRTTAEGLRLFAYPVKELETLRSKTHEISPQPLRAGANALAEVKGELLEVVADISVGQAEKIEFYLRGVPVIYDARKQELVCQDRTAPLKPVDGRIRLRAYVDRTGLTIFANDGEVYMPMAAAPAKTNLGLSLATTGEGAEIRSLQVHELSSIWKNKTNPP